jgi:hypothetical protein
VTIAIEPTAQIVVVNGVPSRRWLGTTGEGIPCDVFVALIRVAREEDHEPFQRELRSMPQPTGEAIDLRLLT